MDSSPLRIGYCLSLSGVLASNGKTARLAHQIRQENVDTNRKRLGWPIAVKPASADGIGNNLKGIYHHVDRSISPHDGFSE